MSDHVVIDQVRGDIYAFVTGGNMDFARTQLDPDPIFLFNCHSLPTVGCIAELADVMTHR